MLLLIALAIIAILGANLFVSYISISDRLATLQQKVIQVLLVWLIPVLGAAFVWFLRRAAYSQQRLKPSEWRNPPFGPDEDIPHN